MVRLPVTIWNGVIKANHFVLKLSFNGTKLFQDDDDDNEDQALRLENATGVSWYDFSIL